MQNRHIVIIGVGFAALTAAKEARAKDSNVKITLIGRKEEFIYLPSLIWIPSGIRQPDDLRIPLGNFLRKHHIDFFAAEVTGLKDGGRTVVTDKGEIANDGLIIGSPVYFRNISSLCMAFLERLSVLRKPGLLLANTPLGALSVGAYRNGGQEMAIQQIQAAMLCHEVMIVGGKPGAHQGATLLNAYNDDIMKDEFGVKTAKQLGIRVAEAALRLE